MDEKLLASASVPTWSCAIAFSITKICVSSQELWRVEMRNLVLVRHENREAMNDTKVKRGHESESDYYQVEVKMKTPPIL